MKVMILAGGVGTRISEDRAVRPNPIAEIVSMPILRRILKICSSFGLNDFLARISSRRSPKTGQRSIRRCGGLNLLNSAKSSES